MADTTAGTTSQPGEFGQSAEFGQRLSPTPPWNDLWAMILFYLHVLTVIVVIIVYFVQYPTLADIMFGSDDTEVNYYTPLYVSMVIALVIAMIFGLLWLQLMKMYPDIIIKMLLGLNILLWIIGGVLLFILTNEATFMIPFIIMALFLALYTWCIWSRIPFASALLSVATRIIQTYEGTIVVSIIVTLFQFVWVIIWIFLFVCYLVSLVEDQAAGGSGEVQMGVVFLLLISLYWGLNVFRNVSHCTSCGVAATWFFNAGKIHKPSWGALQRSLTRSFGSICLGSLIVAILQATRTTLRMMKRGALGIIVACFLICIEWLIRYFNMYAFAHCAIYGANFLTAAKQTWNLFATRGFTAIINDDLTGIALVSGCCFGAIASYFGAAGIIFAMSGVDISDAIPWTYAIISFYIGYMMVSVIMYCVRSGVVTLFVCFSEDPFAMQTNRPDEFNLFVSSKEQIDTFVKTFNVGPQNPQPGVTQNNP